MSKAPVRTFGLGLLSVEGNNHGRKDDLIAIEPVHSHRMAAAFPVKTKTSVGWRINASPFCKHYNIRVDATERFTSPEIRDGKLHLKLTETVTIRQMRRKKNM